MLKTKNTCVMIHVEIQWWSHNLAGLRGWCCRRIALKNLHFSSQEDCAQDAGFEW